jgi:cytochrome P450
MAGGTGTATSIDVFGNLGGGLHQELRGAALAGPVAIDRPTGATVFLRQRDVEALAHDTRVIGTGLAFFDVMGITEGPLRDWYSQLMFTTEGDYHRRIRSLVSRAFTPRAVELLRDAAATLATQAVAGLARDGGDLIDACSMLSMRMMCRLLGVPEADLAVFVGWADALSPIFVIMTPDQVAAATDAIAELLPYVDELTRRRAADPGPDLITALLSAEHDGERLTHDEVVTMIANLLVAGHDTTTSQIGCSLLVALSHYDELQWIGADQARLTSAVAETMRLEPGIPLLPRTAAVPIELHGATIPAGAMVWLCTAAANRDETAWPEPNRFQPDRFTRPDTPKLLVFGAGQHFCLGAALARLTVEECVRAVLAADPPLRLDENEAEIPWRAVLGRSPARLSVTRV